MDNAVRQCSSKPKCLAQFTGKSVGNRDVEAEAVKFFWKHFGGGGREGKCNKVTFEHCSDFSASLKLRHIISYLSDG